MRIKMFGNSDEAIYELITRRHPIEFEERIDVLSRPLIIEVAYPGWQPRYWGPRRFYSHEPLGYAEGGVRFEPVPQSIDETVEVLIESIKAGACAAHVHPRDPDDPKCWAVHDIDLTREIYDRVFAKVDVVTLNETWKSTTFEPTRPDYVGGTQEFLDAAGGGNLYAQGAVMLWPPNNAYPPGYTQSVQDGTRYMEAHNVKPIHKLRSAYHVRQMWRTLVEPGIITQKPFVLVHDMGHPHGWPLDIHPWWPVDMVASIEQTRQRMPDSVIGVFSGGRNWLPITIQAILLGVDLVRVGIEDCYWEYPHRDDVIQTNVSLVEKVVNVCKMIGRPVATAGQAREIMGLKLVRASDLASV